jgi:DNA-binding response OmpR family regulator
MKRDHPLVAAVNNDATFLHLLEVLLRDAGYQTLLIQAGDLGYTTIKQQRPQVVIIDIDIDVPTASWRTVDLLLLDPDTMGIPLIICTVADQVVADRSQKLQAAGCTVIYKPFTIDELAAQVRARVDAQP